MKLTLKVWQNNGGKWMVYVLDPDGHAHAISPQFTRRSEAITFAEKLYLQPEYGEPAAVPEY